MYSTVYAELLDNVKMVTRTLYFFAALLLIFCAAMVTSSRYLPTKRGWSEANDEGMEVYDPSAGRRLGRSWRRFPADDVRS